MLFKKNQIKNKLTNFTVNFTTLTKEINSTKKLKQFYKYLSQKKIYSLTEAAISFVPIIFDLAHWSNTYHKPSPEHVKPIKDYMSGNKNLIKQFQNGLREIHLYKKPINKVDLIFQELAAL